MSVALYFDVHVPLAIAEALRDRGIDVLRAQEDGTEQFADPDLLDRSTDLQRVLVTEDKDFLVEATRRMREGRQFGGILFARRMHADIGLYADDLELICLASDAAAYKNRVQRLPLS